MKSQLVVSVLGTDRPGIVSELCKIAAEAGCNVESSRMTTLGSEFAVVMLLSGKWDTIAKFENQIPSLEHRGLSIQTRRTQEAPALANTIRYDISVVSMDHPGLIYNISQFFTERQINIEDLLSNTYTASYTKTPMFCLDMSVNIDYQIKISELRDQFLSLCEELNVDAAMEPAKI